MTRASTLDVLLTLDVALLRTGARRLGRDRARVVAVAVATWATIIVATSSVAVAVVVRLGVAAGMPSGVARAIVVAVIVAAAGASIVRLSCASGLAPRLAAPDSLRAALDVTPGTGAVIGAWVHAWMLAVATLPLAATWASWDPAPELALAMAAALAAVAGGCIALARSSSRRRGRAPRAGAVLGSVPRSEVVAVASCSAIVAASMLPIAASMRDALAGALASAPLESHRVAGAALVAGAATIVASDRLLDPGTRARMRRATALVEAGAGRARIVARLARETVVVWGALAGLGLVAALAWGAPPATGVGVGGAILAIGAIASTLAVGVPASLARAVWSALAAGLVALAPSWTTIPLAAVALGAMVAVTDRRLRCPPS